MTDLSWFTQLCPYHFPLICFVLLNCLQQGFRLPNRQSRPQNGNRDSPRLPQIQHNAYPGSIISVLRGTERKSTQAYLVPMLLDAALCPVGKRLVKISFRLSSPKIA